MEWISKLIDEDDISARGHGCTSMLISLRFVLSLPRPFCLQSRLLWVYTSHSQPCTQGGPFTPLARGRMLQRVAVEQREASRSVVKPSHLVRSVERGVDGQSAFARLRHTSTKRCQPGAMPEVALGRPYT